MRIFTLIPVFLLLSFGVDQKNKADDVLGIWLTDEGRAKIEIYRENNKYSGKIIWLKDSIDDQGKPRLDNNNPDEEKRKLPIKGINLVKDFSFDDGQWEGGTIYDPENGKTYACRMRLKRGKLEVRGYIGIAMFGRTVVWTRLS